MTSARALLLALMLPLCSTVVSAAEAPIASVVLYPGSATIERIGQVGVGATHFDINGLPANFDQQTLRVVADPGIQIGQIVTRQIGRTETTDAREAALLNQIQLLRDRAAVIDIDARSAAMVSKYLESLSSANVAATDRPQPYVDARSMAAVLDTIRRNGSDALERIHRAEVAKRDIDKKIEVLDSEVARLHSGAKDGRDITVNLVAKKAGAIRVSYQVNGAGWKPAYRASLDSKLSIIDLERLATISQKTGEDWSGVKLRLSTGQPRLTPRAPEPQPWLLSYFKPQPAREALGALSAAPMAAPAPQPLARAKSKAADNAAAAEPQYEPPVLEVQNNFTTEFEVPTRISLPSDGREVSVALARQNIAVTQRVRVAPRLDVTAVVTAQAPRPAGVWLSGDIQLFRDGNYVGATQWNTQANEGLLFAFGRDDLIRVTVDRAGENSGTSGILKKQNERNIADRYTVTSSHRTPLELVVLESSPVSTSDEVKVQTEFSPKPTSVDWENRRGVVAWVKTIGPGESLKFDVKYRIVFPTEGRVTGLP